MSNEIIVIEGYSKKVIKYYLSVLESKKVHYHHNQINDAYRRLYKVVYGEDSGIVDPTAEIHKDKITVMIVHTQNLLTALDLFKE